nr:hypothetical protein [Sphingobium chlorophenolicum]
MKRPVGQQRLDLLLKPRTPILRLLDGALIFLERNMLSWVIETLIAKPTTVLLGPMFDATIVGSTMSQKKGQELLSYPTNSFHRRNPRPDEITLGFMLLVGNPDRCELAGSKQAGQYNGIAAVGLNLATAPPDR